MALLEGLLQSLPIQISAGAESLGELNPVYLLPVLVVVAGCFLVYAFGFTSSVSVPPTLHLLTEDVHEKRTKQRNNKQRQQQAKTNGHANGHAVSPAKKPVAAKSKSEEPKSKPTKAPEPAPAPKPQQPARQPKKRREAEVPDEGLNTGDWVQVVRKEKKDRKQKGGSEKPAVTANKKDSESPKKNKMAVKASASVDKVDGKEPTAAVTKPAEQPTSASLTSEAKMEPRPQRESGGKKQNKASTPSKPEATVEVVQAADEVVAEDPEQYTLVPSKQLSKKALSKEQQKKQRRISESEKQQQSPPQSPVTEVPEEAPVLPKPADKITAEIVASYDAGFGDKPATTAAKSKNKKKNKKPAAAAEAVEPPPKPAAAAPPPKEGNNKKKTPPPASPVKAVEQKPPAAVATEPAPTSIPIPAPVAVEKKSSEISEVTDESHESEGEFKTVVKKRKARRE